MHLQNRINFFRGIAILAVFANHLSIVRFGNYEVFFHKGLFFDFAAYPTTQIILNFLPFAGLELFLVLSGFLIHLGYLKAGNCFGFYQFFNKRFWRIVPPYLLALCIFTPFFFRGWWDVVAHASFTHNLFGPYQFSINPSYWSLGLEVQLYLMYPLFLWLRRNIGLRKTFYTAIAVSIIAGAFALLKGTVSAALQLSVFIYWIIWVGGALLAERYRQGKRLTQLNGIQLAALLLLIIGLKVFSFGFYLSPFLFAAYYVLLIDWVLHTPFQLSPQAKWVGRLIMSVGICSYSIYLLHQPFLHLIYNYLLLAPNQYWAQALAGIMSFMVTHAASRLYNKWVEMPSIRMGTVFYNRISTLRKTQPLQSEISRSVDS